MASHDAAHESTSSHTFGIHDSNDFNNNWTMTTTTTNNPTPTNDHQRQRPTTTTTTNDQRQRQQPLQPQPQRRLALFQTHWDHHLFSVGFTTPPQLNRHHDNEFHTLAWIISTTATTNATRSHALSSPPGRIRRDTSALCTGLRAQLVGGVFADLSPPLGLQPLGSDNNLFLGDVD